MFVLSLIPTKKIYSNGLFTYLWCECEKFPLDFVEFRSGEHANVLADHSS